MTLKPWPSWCLGSIELGNVEIYLLQAVQNNDEAVAEILLDAGADPNWYPPTLTPLLVAAKQGNIALAKMLLDHGATPDEGQPPPIVAAVWKEHPEMFYLLRAYGARLDTPETGAWAMTVAMANSLDSMVDLLVRESVSVNEVLHRVDFDHFSSVV
ncbi:hypothetical protein GQ53DRAFT_812868 [Thozetella sp. PMI_491]|nr:hypothetical protein GQ53DRAFT_812868 [Thozetella sp. PMI_491]